MEAARRWWIRPAVAVVLGLIAVCSLMGVVGGRDSGPHPRETPIEPSAVHVAVPTRPDLEAPLSPTPGPTTARTTATTTATTTVASPSTAPTTVAPRRPVKHRVSRQSRPGQHPREAPKTRPQPAVAAKPTPACTAEPLPKLGWLGNLRDRRIDESSGLTLSPGHADLAYTMNDEGTSPLVFGIQPSTGRTVSAFDLTGAGDFKDPEAIRADARGRIWLADTGDGHPGKPGKKHDPPHRPHVGIAVFDEPGPGRFGSVRARRYSVVFSNGPHNVEALAIHPVSGQAFLISSNTVGRVFRLPNPLQPGRNIARATNHTMPGFVTDATFTADGRHVLVRTMRTPDVLVFDARSWKRVGRVSAPRMTKGESISVEPEGRTALLGSEGRHSPLIRLELPGFLQTPTVTKSRC